MKAGASHMITFPSYYHTCSIRTVQAIIEHCADVNAVNNRGQTPLWFACADGQDSFVKILLDAGAEPNIADDYGDSCLHAAIRGQCNTETIQKIVDHGAHVNVLNKDGATPLLLACSTAQAEAVRLLLKSKADPDIADADGDAGLHAATAADCSKETLQEVIDFGADMNAVNKRGRTALLLSCVYRQTDSVKILLKAGADPTIADEEGFSCLHAAIDGRCSTAVLQALLHHGARIDAARKDGTNALLRACTTGQSESVRFLVEAGADVSITKRDGNTCLHIAVKGKCSKAAVQKIIGKGVKVNKVNNRGETALLLACESAQAETVKLLLTEGADPKIHEGEGNTSLHAAVYGCCTNDILQEIIAHKIHLDAQNIHGKTALFLACSYRRQEFVKILLEAGSNPNIADNKGDTCLHATITGGCSKWIIRTLIENGAYVNATNKDNTTVLMKACGNGKAGTINVLLDAGADPNITDVYGYTCLSYASYGKCSKDDLQAIIDSRVDVNATSKQNKTALIWACEKGNVHAINVLLNAGADPNIVDVNGETCLVKAISARCNKQALQAIIDHGVDVNATSKLDQMALMVASRTGNVDAINALLYARDDLHIANDDRDICLLVAAREGYSKEVLQALINHGADVNATDKTNISRYKQTVLMNACEKGNEDAINVLLHAGADTTISDTDGYTCLHKAVNAGCNKQTLQALINHGADVNATSKLGNTALNIACWKGNVEAIDVLLHAGADTTISDTDGYTCLHKAVNAGCNKQTLQALINHGADVNATSKLDRTALKIACKKGNVDAIDVLLHAGADTTISDTDGYTCLHKAVNAGCNKQTLQALINHGADVNATSKLGNTALNIACWKGNVEAIDVLLHAGADTTISDTDGYTCLHKAVNAGCNKQTLQALINHGADVNATSKLDRTALKIACRKGNVDAIDVLLHAGADTTISDIGGYTCLHRAVGAGCNKQTLQALINHGADVNATRNLGHTALNIACEKGNVDAIDVLLHAGADTTISDTNGCTCLHKAVDAGCNKQTLQALINYGADVNATSKKLGDTALKIACVNGNVDAINVLLNARDDLHIANDDRYVHFRVASRGGYSNEVFRALINHGADGDARNVKNCKEVFRAQINNDADVDARNAKYLRMLMWMWMCVGLGSVLVAVFHYTVLGLDSRLNGALLDMTNVLLILALVIILIPCIFLFCLPYVIFRYSFGYLSCVTLR